MIFSFARQISKLHSDLNCNCCITTLTAPLVMAARNPQTKVQIESLIKNLSYQ